MKEYSEPELRAMIRSACEKAGSQAAFARQIDVSPAYVSDVMGGYRRIGPDFLKAVGVRKEVTVRYLDDKEVT